MNNCEKCYSQPACMNCVLEVFKLYEENRLEWLVDSCRSSESRSQSSPDTSLSGFIVNDSELEIIPETTKPTLNFVGTGFDEPLNLTPIPNQHLLIKRPTHNTPSSFPETDLTLLKPSNSVPAQKNIQKRLDEARNRIKRERKELARANENDDYLDEILSDISYFKDA